MNTQRETFNQQVGARMLRQRRQRGMTQKQVGELLGVSLQQVQKYEKGRSALSVEKLHQLSKAFSMPYGFWFGDDFSTDDLTRLPRAHDAQAIRLVRDYYELPNAEIRTLLCALARTLTRCRA